MENSYYNLSRKKFLKIIAGAGSFVMLNPLSSWTQINEIDPRVASIVAKTIGIDTHNHIDVPLNSKELPGTKINLSEELKKSGLSAISMTFAVDYQKFENPEDAYSRFLTGLDAMDKIFDR